MTDSGLTLWFLVVAFVVQLALFVWFVTRVEAIYKQTKSIDDQAEVGMALLRDLISAVRTNSLFLEHEMADSPTGKCPVCPTRGPVGSSCPAEGCRQRGNVFTKPKPKPEK